MQEKILELKNLSYLNIFNHFNIKFTKNTFYAISGPNNCGKTSLIRILSGQNTPLNILFFNNVSLEEYKLDNYYQQVKTVIPLEIYFQHKKLEDELMLYLSSENKEIYTYLMRKLKLRSYNKSLLTNLSKKIIIKIQLLLALLTSPKILLLDSLDSYFTHEEFNEIIEILKYFQLKGLTIIMTTNNLSTTLKTDYLIVLSNNSILLEGTPLEVLKKDNILNKIGLELPFIIDLSIKLSDYDLLNEIELNMENMVNTLWK